MGTMGGEGEMEGEIVTQMVGSCVWCLWKKILRTFDKAIQYIYKSGILSFALHGSLWRITIAELGHRGD